MTFLGIGGLAEIPDFVEFVDRTGTSQVVHLADESGELWEQFGAVDRSTFLFVNDDGTYVLSNYGAVDESRLSAEIERLRTS